MELRKEPSLFWTTSFIILMIPTFCRCFNPDLEEQPKKANTTAMEKLRKDLVKDYHSIADAKTVPVNITLVINRVTLSYKDSIFAVNGWLIQEWWDPKLKWNASKYDGINVVHMAPYEIWRPEIISYDSVSGYQGSYDDTNFLVNSSGRVFWMPPITYKVYCKLDIVNWPFDTQNCSLQLCPQSYDNNDLILSFNSEKKYVIQNVTGNWKITSVQYTARNIERSVGYSESVPPYTSLIYVFEIQKNHMVYHNFVTLPAFGILVLLLSSFWLLPEEIERILLAGLVSTVSGLFLFFFAVKVPLLLYETPNIIKYYGWMLSLSLTYTILTVVLYNITHRPSIAKIEPPASCTKFLNFCGQALFFLSFKRVSPTVYDDLGDTEAIPVDDSDGEEGTSSSTMRKTKTAFIAGPSKSEQRWRVISLTIDNLCFVFYAIFCTAAFILWV